MERVLLAGLRYDVVLARYGEIGLKSRSVRRRFEQALQENIERAFEAQGLDGVVQRLPGRILVASSDLARAQAILSRIFGLTSVSRARIATSDLPQLLTEIPKFLEEVAAERPRASTFALRVRRSGRHAYTSQDVARQGGAAVPDRWKVDLTRPDIEVFVEVRDRQAFLFHERVEAPGGLPVGTQGRVVVLLKDLNSLVAAWLMMKRGCTILPVTFTGVTGQRQRAQELMEDLRKWNFRGALTELAHEETSEFPTRAACVLCMRQMVRKAGLFARRKKAKALVTGESFTSTTVESLTQFGAIAPVPILRPVLGMTPAIVADFARRAGIAAGRSERFAEPCPLRVPGRVDEADVVRWEGELGLEVRAFDAVRERPSLTVKP